MKTIVTELLQGVESIQVGLLGIHEGMMVELDYSCYNRITMHGPGTVVYEPGKKEHEWLIVQAIGYFQPGSNHFFKYAEFQESATTINHRDGLRIEITPENWESIPRKTRKDGSKGFAY